MTGRLSIFANLRALASEAALFIVRSMQERINESGRANLVLSGGKTPRSVYELMPSLATEHGLDWNLVDLFWGDERSVPPGHTDSNFRMAKEALLRHIAIPGRNIHRIMSEHPAKEAARIYSEEIRGFFSLKEGEVPGFDLLLLGLGPDGHVASIFPGTSAEREKEELVTAVHVEKLITDRITVTLPVLNQATTICMLVSGAEKAEAMKSALEGGGPALPVHQLRPSYGKIHWYADREAASLLKERNV